MEQVEELIKRIESLENKVAELEEKTVRFKKPTIQECAIYCGDMKQAELFWHYWESKDWVRGKTKMKRWKSALTQWMKSNNSKTTRLNGSDF